MHARRRTYTNSNTYWEPHSYRHGCTNGDSDRHGYSYGHSNSYRHDCTDRDSHRYGNSYRYRDSYGYRNSNSSCHDSTYGDALSYSFAVPMRWNNLQSEFRWRLDLASRLGQHTCHG